MRSDTMDKEYKLVLIIEDSATQARFLQFLLEEQGLQALLAVNGEMGVRMAQQLNPNLIILDLELPRLDGFQVYQQLRQLPDTTHIPVLLFTHHDNPQVADLSLQDGIVGCILKGDLEGKELLAKLGELGLIGPTA